MADTDSHEGRLVFAALGAMLLISTLAVSAYAQEGYKVLSGKYLNSEAGVELTFPDGWTGAILETVYLQGTVVPGGLNGTAPTKTITLMVGIKNLTASKGLIDPTMLTNYTDDCDAPLLKSRIVSGVNGIEVNVECPGKESTWRMITVESDARWVLVIYEAPTTEFAADLGKFEATVDSLKVQGAIDSTLGTGTSIKTTYVQVVTIGGELVDLKFVTSTGVLDLELNEETKTLSFKVNGTDESTIVLAGAVLEGPYVVTIDGEASDFEETISYPGVNTISLPHGVGEHDIIITGTQVVPEFPIAALGAVAALIGIAALLGRRRFMKH